MDDSDIKTTKNTRKQKKEVKNVQRDISYVGNVFSATRIRCFIQNNNGFDWVILDSRRRLLLHFRLFLVIVYIIIEILK